ncbi:MAG: N-6 DNA methylase [bacterium]|nr:N-6 DNA methylase [bacterium]
MFPENNTIESRLWEAADELRANSKLKSHEFSIPVLGLIFLRYADYRFSCLQKELKKKPTWRRKIGRTDYQARGVLYIPENARFSHLLNLTEESNIGKAVNEAMKAVEDENEELRDVLPKIYKKLENKTLVELLKLLSSIHTNIEGDIFGKIYEYFLSSFAMTEGQRGGEFFTTTSIVKLIVEVIEPFHGKLLDPACGSGGMFIQSSRFIENHQKKSINEISVYGQEKIAETVRLCKMNLAIHGLSGDIRECNTYYEDVHNMIGAFDFVMANPPFNVNKVDKERIKNDLARFPFGMPKADNANYLWIQIFYSALNNTGRAGFVMANSANDPRGAELEILKKLIRERCVDVMISIATNFFYTVSLPCTLWFLDKGKRGTPRENKVLFIDARKIFRQNPKALRDFSSEQVEFIANIVRLFRGRAPEFVNGSRELIQKNFSTGDYGDIPGLCRVATLDEIEDQGWSLNPARYIRLSDNEGEEFDFKELLKKLNAEFEILSGKGYEFEKRIKHAIGVLLK